MYMMVHNGGGLHLLIWKNGQIMYFWKRHLTLCINDTIYIFLICEYGHWKDTYQNLSDGACFLLLYIKFLKNFLWFFKKHISLLFWKLSILFVKPLYTQRPRFLQQPRKSVGLEVPWPFHRWRHQASETQTWSPDSGVVFSHPRSYSKIRGMWQISCQFWFKKNPVILGDPLSCYLLSAIKSNERAPSRTKHSESFMLHHLPLAVGSGN